MIEEIYVLDICDKPLLLISEGQNSHMKFIRLTLIDLQMFTDGRPDR